MAARLPGLGGDLAALTRVYPLVVVGLAIALYGWIATSQPSRDASHIAVLLVAMTLANPRRPALAAA